MDLGDGIHALDTLMGGHPGVTAGYLLLTSRPCLVETGAATSVRPLRTAMGRLGVRSADLATIVVTHVHLDHAGGTGDLAAAYPNARVVVHEAGVRHLVDPGRLMASARRVFGALLDRLFGELRPTEAARVQSAVDGTAVDLGDGRRLTAVYSPGHARHHVGMLDSQTGDLYVGDAAGIYIPEIGLLRASTPPPDFDLDVALRSLHRFAELRPTRLLFSHFGPVSDVQPVLQRAREELRLWVEHVREARGRGADLDHAVQLVRERTAGRYRALYADPELDASFEQLSSTATNIAGISRWLDQADAEPAPGG